MSSTQDWFKRLQQLSIPAVLPVDELPDGNAPLSAWIEVIREDPLLTIHLFRYANKLLASNDVSVRTLDQAVTLLGSDRLMNLTVKIERLQRDTLSNEGLLRAIGDSLVASSLMRQWFEIRQIPWTEADYWMTLFFDLGRWVCWLLEPTRMEQLEYQVNRGEQRDKLMASWLGMPPRQWNQQLCQYFQLPVMVDLDDTPKPDNRIQSYKQSALKFFLPFSHDLSFAIRQDWHSDALDSLCRTGEISLGLTEFKPMLKNWSAMAAREFKLPQASIAARRLLAQQPSLTKSQQAGFSDADIAAASSLGVHKNSTKKTNNMELTEKQTDKKSTKSNNGLFNPDTTKAESQKPLLSKRSALLDLNLLREIRRQLRHQTTWHSPVEIQESALYGLQKGLNMARLVVLESDQGFWQAFDSEGCQTFPLLRKLKLPKESSDTFAEMGKKVTAVWVNKSNITKATKMLPPPLMSAADENGFFLRSFAIGGSLTMMIYADAFGQEENLSEQDYRLFREYCADWNTALNKIKV